MDDTFVIVDADGNEHEFPAGMDPKKAAGFVRSQATAREHGEADIAAGGDGLDKDVTPTTMTHGASIAPIRPGSETFNEMSRASVDPASGLLGVEGGSAAMGGILKGFGKLPGMYRSAEEIIPPLRGLRYGADAAGSTMKGVLNEVAESPSIISSPFRALRGAVRGFKNSKFLQPTVPPVPSPNAGGTLTKGQGTIEQQMARILEEGFAENARAMDGPASMELPPQTTMTAGGRPATTASRFDEMGGTAGTIIDDPVASAHSRMPPPLSKASQSRYLSPAAPKPANPNAGGTLVPASKPPSLGDELAADWATQSRPESVELSPMTPPETSGPAGRVLENPTPRAWSPEHMEPVVPSPNAGGVLNREIMATAPEDELVGVLSEMLGNQMPPHVPTSPSGAGQLGRSVEAPTARAWSPETAPNLGGRSVPASAAQPLPGTASATASTAKSIDPAVAQKLRHYLGSKDAARYLKTTEAEILKASPGPSRRPGIADDLENGEFTRAELIQRILASLGVSRGQ